jgi:hypothetical protein
MRITRRNMTKTLALFAALALFAVASFGDEAKPKSNVKTTKITTNDIAVSCRDGMNPQVKDLENGVLVISCSK